MVSRYTSVERRFSVTGLPFMGIRGPKRVFRDMGSSLS